jgi:hypothetical protein
VDQQLAKDLARALAYASDAFASYAQRKQEAEYEAEDETFARTRATVSNKLFFNRDITDADALRRQSGGPVRQP